MPLSLDEVLYNVQSNFELIEINWASQEIAGIDAPERKVGPGAPEPLASAAKTLGRATSCWHP